MLCCGSGLTGAYTRRDCHRAVERMVVSGNPRLGDELGVKRKEMGFLGTAINERDRDKEGSRQFRRTYFSTYKVCTREYSCMIMFGRATDSSTTINPEP